MKTKNICLSALALFTLSCSNVSTSYNESQFIGRWQEIMPEGKNYIQGVVFEENGTASSIGMATLKYHNWKLIDGKSIVLSGESIGNGQVIAFSDTLNVLSLQGDTLILERGNSYRMQFKKQNLIGGSDAAMGYTFSKVLNKKIRIFESGIKVLSTTDPQATLAGYLVFADDSSKVELFLPEQTVILDKRTRPNGTSVWNVEDDDTFMVEKSNGEWIVTRRGKLLYSSECND